MELMFTLHVPVPEQGPAQPEKVDPAAGKALRVTTIAGGKVVEHVLPQLIPSGVPTTVPEPLPFSVSERTNPALARKTVQMLLLAKSAM